SEKVKTIGGILIGFGMLFVGLTLMSDSMESFAHMESVKLFLASINNSIMLVLIGIILTAIIQSSSVLTSIALTMIVTNLISLEQGIYLIMGSNIGSCVVAIIAGITSGINAKRTALIHLIFNCFGVILFLVLGCVLRVASNGTLTFGTIFENLFITPQIQLAMFHTFFNLFTVAIMLPLTSLLVRICMHIVPNKEEDTVQSFTPNFHFVDEKMLRTPAIAIRQIKLEIEKMAETAMENYNLALDMITTMNFDQLDKFNSNEKQLNFLNRELVQYIVLLDGQQVNEEDHQYLTSSIRSIGDLERIGDYSENITEYAQSLRDASETFSDNAINSIEELRQHIATLYEKVMKAYIDLDIEALDEANVIEEQVDEIRDNMQSYYVEQLSMGLCTATVGSHYVSLAGDSERIADHLINVAKTIRNLIDAPYGV
ncbi:MAG: Na/Pi cotransporter family protein, partial [Paludibacteraceae bacterium]|nr:Na/Pi cotransporter family protein [Paludibacteraceae bacterium]